ncbi:MinD/ParA family protein [Rhodococcus fascians]|nr:MinD/ParA family protein [Rhodococcus fascians]
MPQNSGAPQNNWGAPQGPGGPHVQGPGGPQGQWTAQNQWAAQAGHRPQVSHPAPPHPGPPYTAVPHPDVSHPVAPHALSQQRGAGDAQVLVPQALPVAQVLPVDRAVQQPVSSHDLGTSLLVRSGNVPPVSGWRRALYAMSGGHIDVGNSASQQHRLALTAQVDRTLVGCYRVAVLSLKGGVGKTTTTATLGSTFADVRGDRVIAIDANPDRGTLGQKVPSETTATVRNLLRDIDFLERYSDVRAYTSQNANRLEVLASDSDPAASEAFSGEDYDRAVDMLEKFYSIVITDCGTGLMHSAMESILEGTDTLVVVSSASVDGARSASATLDWLDAHGYRELVASSVAVVNGVRPRAGKVDLQKVIDHFEQRCAHVRTIPYDPHLEEGAEIELDRLRGRTRTALLEVAAAVATGFPDSPTASRPNR